MGSTPACLHQLLTWLLFIGVTGAIRAAESGGEIFAAWNPYYLRVFWTRGRFAGAPSWEALGGCFLCVTGAEALFADLGHFGLPAISLAWFMVVYPCLLLSYTGQAAWLLTHGDLTDAVNPTLCFSIDASSGAATPGSGHPPYATYLSFPAAQPACIAEGFVGLQSGSSGPSGVIQNAFWWSSGRRMSGAQFHFALAIATLASIVASQALISGVFTVLSQAAARGLFPFIRVVHTSTLYEHQIYSPTGMRALAIFVRGKITRYHLAYSCGGPSHRMSHLLRRIPA